MRKLFFLTLIIPVIGHSQYKVTGKVIEGNNIPLEYAEVILQTLDSVHVKSELTNEQGAFIFNDINKGDYILTVKYFSKNVHSQIITVENNIDVEPIHTDAAITLDDIIITAKPNLKKELGKYVLTNISSSKFSENKTTYEFLNTVPLLETSADGSKLKIRNKGDATILINGKNVGGNDIALNMIQSIPATDIKKIEIIKSPDSKYSANNKNGIVNIILNNKKNEGLKGVISSRIAQSYFNSQNADEYISYAKGKWLLTSGINFSNAKIKYTSNYIYDEYINNTQTIICANKTYQNRSIVPYLNLNYNISDKQSFGVQFNSRFVNSNSFSKIINSYNINNIDSTNTGIIQEKAPKILTLFSNVNYNIKTDSLGSIFEVNLNFYTNNKNVNSFNNFIYEDGSNNNFVQNPNITTNVGNLRADFDKILKSEDEINLGFSYTKSAINNDFFYGNYNGLNYISDSQQSNIFKYKDFTLAGYSTYEKIINDKWEGKIGLRVEHFETEGKTNSNVNRLKNTYLFPSFSVLFTPSNEHEFSLDIGSSIITPWYSYLTPFVSYTSSTSYKVSNPYLLPTISYELLFNYTFFENFSFDFEYAYDKNLFNDFDVVLSNNDIQTLTDNYGNGNDYYFGLMYSKDFFDSKWHFSTSLGYDYNNSKGTYNGINLDFEDSSYYFSVKNNIILNKKQDMILSLNYGFHSGSKSILGNLNALHSLTVNLSKSFNNFYLSIGAYDLAQADVKLTENRDEYGFYKKIDYYKTYYFTLRYNFGNKKVKRVYDKENDIDKRLQ